MARQARLIIVRGVVQGVGFRYFVQRTGKKLGLTGDVRNLPEGAVQIIAEGAAHKLEEFAEEVRRGPSMARVERFEMHEIAVTDRYATFMLEGW